jgi:hypothetical protein
MSKSLQTAALAHLAEGQCLKEGLTLNNNNNNNNNNNKINKIRRVLKEKKWKSKVMHGHYVRSVDRQLISEEDTLLWLLWGDLEAETEIGILAAQDQTILT